MECEPILLTFGIGIQIAISFSDFRCFTSNQTGNSVVLAVGLSAFDAGLFNTENVGIGLRIFLAMALFRLPVLLAHGEDCGLRLRICCRRYSLLELKLFSTSTASSGQDPRH